MPGVPIDRRCIGGCDTEMNPAFGALRYAASRPGLRVPYRGSDRSSQGKTRNRAAGLGPESVSGRPVE